MSTESLRRAAESSTVFSSLLEQLTIFPLRPIVRTSAGVACTCAGRASCDNIGKHPDGSVQSDDPRFPEGLRWSLFEAGEKFGGYPGCGYGIATGVRSGIFVVDLDGEEAIKAFSATGPVPRTLLVRRGDCRGHVYFRCPDFLVKTGAGEIGPGIDVRGEGGYVVAPGSPHRSGDVYEIVDDAPVADAPAWLLALPCLRRPDDAPGVGRAGPAPLAAAPVPVVAGSEDEAECIEEAIKVLTTAPPAISGQKGHGTLWVVAQRLMRSFELPMETAYGLLQQHYNPRCIPAWSERELRHKLQQARDKGNFELRSHQLRFNRELLSEANAR